MYAHKLCNSRMCTHKLCDSGMFNTKSMTLICLYTLRSSPVLPNSCTELIFCLYDLWQEIGTLVQISDSNQSDLLQSNLRLNMLLNVYAINCCVSNSNRRYMVNIITYGSLRFLDSNLNDTYFVLRKLPLYFGSNMIKNKTVISHKLFFNCSGRNY